MSLDTAILAEPSLQSLWKLDEASGTFADSKGSNTGTGAGTLTYAQTGPLGNAVKSNGATPTRINHGNIFPFSGTSAWSFLALINRGTDTDGRLAAHYNESTGHGWLIACAGSKLYAIRHNGTTGTDITGGTTLAANAWYLVHATYDGSNLRIYVNGVSDATAVASTQSEASPTTFNFSLFGNSLGDANTTAVYFFGGTMQRAAVFNAALSAATVAAQYQAFLTSGVRMPAGGLVTIFTAGTVGTSSAHYAFPTLVRQANGTLRCFARKGTTHNSYDGSVVSKTSTDNGLTWGSETTHFASTVSYEYRQAVPRLLASGRIGVALYRRSTADGLYAEYAYSDDNGATWSTPVNVTNGFNADAAVGDDVIELANGDLIFSMYGSAAFPTTSFTIRVSKSTDGGATWSALAQPASTIGGFNSVESTMVLLSNGTIYLTFHTEDGVPTDAYYTRSTDGGATWDGPTQIFDETTYNRHGICQGPEGDLVVAYSDNTNSVCRQSFDRGVSWAPAFVAVDAGHSFTGGMWATPAVIGGRSESPNIGVVTSWEPAAQNQASVYFRGLTSSGGTSDPVPLRRKPHRGLLMRGTRRRR